MDLKLSGTFSALFVQQNFSSDFLGKLNNFLLKVFRYIFNSQEINIRDSFDDKHHLLDFAEVFAHRTREESFELIHIDKAVDKKGKNYLKDRYTRAKFVIKPKYVQAIDMKNKVKDIDYIMQIFEF